MCTILKGSRCTICKSDREKQVQLDDSDHSFLRISFKDRPFKKNHRNSKLFGHLTIAQQIDKQMFQLKQQNVPTKTTKCS